jgi:hypothetical protein
MQSAFHLKTKVLPGNKIEIDVPPGSVGEPVDVFVILPEKPEPKRGSVLELLEQIRSQRACKIADEIDQQLQKERDSWES